MAHRDHVAVEPAGRVADDRRRLRVAVEGALAAEGEGGEVVAREAGGRGAGRGMGEHASEADPRGFTGGAAGVARDGGAAWIPLSGCQRCGIHGVGEDGGDEGGGESGEDGGEAFHRGF